MLIREYYHYEQNMKESWAFVGKLVTYFLQKSKSQWKNPIGVFCGNQCEAAANFRVGLQKYIITAALYNNELLTLTLQQS